jgi:hypothetical protein
MLELRHLMEQTGQVLQPLIGRPLRNNVALLVGQLWGMRVVCKVSRPLGEMQSVDGKLEYLPGPLEMEAKSAHLLDALPKIADLMAAYLFAGRVPTKTMAGLLNETCPDSARLLAQWRAGSHVDVIVTEHFGPTLRDRCVAAARQVPSDAELEDMTLRMFLRVFVALQRLRDDAATGHQDAKLDNWGELGGNVCLIDFEFAHSDNMPNPTADFVGCGMTPRREAGGDEFDLHTVLYSLFYFCGKRYIRLPRLEALRRRVLGPDWPVPMRNHPYLNKSGLCIVYKIERSPFPTTFEHAIAVVNELLVSHAD